MKDKSNPFLLVGMFAVMVALLALALSGCKDGFSPGTW